MIARLLSREKLQFAALAAMRMGISFSQLVIVVIAASLLAPADFGRFAIIYAGARLLAAFAGLGAPSFLLKDVPWRQAKGMPWHASGAAALTFIAYPALICAAAGAGAEAIGASGTPYYPLLPGEGAAMALLGFCWAGMLALGAYVRTTRSATEAMLVADLYTPLAMLAALGIMAGLVAKPQVTGIVLLCCAVVGATQAAMLVWHAVRGWIPVGGPGAEPVRIRELIAYWGTVLLNTASAQVDILIAGSVVGPVATGVYTVIKRFTNVLAIPLSIATWTIALDVSRAAAADDAAALRIAARSGVQFSFFPAIALAGAVALSSPWWFAWFDIPIKAVTLTVLGILLFANVLNAAFGPSLLFATQTGMPGLANRALGLALASASAWMVVAGSVIGVAGIAAGQLILYFVLKIPIRRAIMNRFGIDFSLLSILRRW